MNNIFPRTKIPNVVSETSRGISFDLHNEINSARKFAIVLFYRGYHCSVCKKQLQNFNSEFETFIEKGVKLFAISSDTVERAKKAKSDWQIGRIPLIHSFPLKNTAEWGLYTSTAISDEEPEKFVEPAMFIVRPDLTLYGSYIQTMPFTRPKAKNVLKAIDFILERDYPARGEYQQFEIQEIKLLS